MTHLLGLVAHAAAASGLAQSTPAPSAETPHEPMVAAAAAPAATPVAAPRTAPLVDVDNLTFLNNGLPAWLAAGVILLAVFLAVTIIRTLAKTRGKARAARTANRVDDFIVDLLCGLRPGLALLYGVAIASVVLVLPDSISRVLRFLAVAAVAVQFLLLGRVVVDAILQMLVAKASKNGTTDETVASSLGVLRFLGILVFSALVILLALENLNVEVTPLLAGLGIGGIAIALAVQNVLGDVFGSLSILLDKPFVVGDFIIVGDKMGTVERIGIKTTRVRALSGEQLIFANSDLLTSRIQNYKRMQERRGVFTLGVVYHTSPEKLRRIPGIIKEAIEHNPNTRFDRCHFKTFGAYSLDFETVYYMTVPDMKAYLDTQQAVNLEIFDRFLAEGIEFAFPTAVEIQLDAGRAPPAPKPTGANFAVPHAAKAPGAADDTLDA